VSNDFGKPQVTQTRKAAAKKFLSVPQSNSKRPPHQGRQPFLLVFNYAYVTIHDD
jgi:hypothetical protein